MTLTKGQYRRRGKQQNLAVPLLLLRAGQGQTDCRVGGRINESMQLRHLCCSSPRGEGRGEGRAGDAARYRVRVCEFVWLLMQSEVVARFRPKARLGRPVCCSAGLRGRNRLGPALRDDGRAPSPGPGKRRRREGHCTLASRVPISARRWRRRRNRGDRTAFSKT